MHGVRRDGQVRGAAPVRPHRALQVVLRLRVHVPSMRPVHLGRVGRALDLVWERAPGHRGWRHTGADRSLPTEVRGAGIRVPEPVRSSRGVCHDWSMIYPVRGTGTGPTRAWPAPGVTGLSGSISR